MSAFFQHYHVAIIVVTAVVVFLLLFLYRVVSEAKDLCIRHIRLRIPDLDPRLEGFKIFFGADIHAGLPLRHRGMANLVTFINEQHADVILLGGDYVGGHFRGNEYFYPAIKNLEARYGTYAVMGNHDYWETEADADRLMAEAGVTLLRNANIRFEHNGAGVNIAGVDDLWAGKPNLEETATGIDQNEFAIMISHNPDIFADGLPNDNLGGFDLALAGHTHAGQITGFGKWAYAPTDHGKRYLKDWRIEDDVPILVTNGVGTIGFPIRFYAPAEIHIIELSRGPQEITNLDEGE
ncbi:MAG: metallophosphoesterase [Coriobacteriia bacterium]|nr:metallophosphoesterase [Coriobacteriia bacterium]